MGRGLDGFIFLPDEIACSFQSFAAEASLTFSGGHGEGETPLPFPNREVKPLSADGT